MTRSELCSLIQSSGLSPTARAAAQMAVMMMPAAEYARVSALADEGYALLRAGDLDGFRSFAARAAETAGIPAAMLTPLLAHLDHALPHSHQ